MQLAHNRFIGAPDLHPFCVSLTAFHFPVVFPEDLREWLSARELARIVAESVRGADRSAVLPEYASRWELLLAWCVYSYLTGRFASEEIGARLRSGLPAGHPLAATDLNIISQFRRRNRAVLEQTLAEALASAHASHETNSLHARWTRACASPDFHAEGVARITKAVQLDCWARDN